MFVSKKLGRFTAAMCALVLSMGSLLAQNITVTGKVVDKNNEPIVGAYVVVLGTSAGTSTNVDGGYVISVPANGTLQFTCIGYKTLETAVAGRKVVDVILDDDALFIGPVRALDLYKKPFVHCVLPPQFPFFESWNATVVASVQVPVNTT